MNSIEADYLVVGAGAMGMAFVDVLLTETDATVVMVDRRSRPGGHWTDAYPFVRLHQPSSFYGVNSRALGSDTIDQVGWNAGLYELASASEVCAYFDQLMNQRFLPSGRVRFFPNSDYRGNGRFGSPVSDLTYEVADGCRIVDATYMNVSVPATHAPNYQVALGVNLVPVNGLADLARRAEQPDGRRPDRYVIVGAGKTGMDACLWLLAGGVDPDRITWITPRDSWLLDRANIQPGRDFEVAAVLSAAASMEISAKAETVDQLFDGLEQAGVLLRIDPDVRPTMYRCATVSRAELEQLRRIDHVVRLGRVRSVEATEIVLDEGTIPSGPDVLLVDCSADGLATRPPVPVFSQDGRGDRLTLQAVRTCQQVFSSAFIAHIEASYDDLAVKNEICTPVPHPDTDIDWMRTTLANTLNSIRWRQDRRLAMWLERSRLDAFSKLGRSERREAASHRDDRSAEAEPPAELVALRKQLVADTGGALANLERLIRAST